MDDIYAKNNVEWTQVYVKILEENGPINIADVLVGCKHLIFPTNEQIEKAEKALAKLEKHNQRSLRKHKTES